MNRRYIITLAVTALGVAALVSPGYAEVTAQEAESLKTSLTAFGAEKAGNKDGSIPAWDGGYTKVDPAWKPGMQRPDPFAGEKPVLSITGSNHVQHAGKLSEGMQLLLKKYPDFRMDVYPTHRTAAYPGWVLENTLKNATRAKTANGGNSLQSAFGGFPFPIPKTGQEAMWNHILAWKGTAAKEKSYTYVVNDGTSVMTAESVTDQVWPYYNKDGEPANYNGDYFHIRLAQTAPAYKAGEAVLAYDNIDPINKGRQAWQYLTGQRRVRKAPSIAYDTPDFVTSGVGNWDEAYVFGGAFDRYDWKLLGKQEMYIPYNNNKFAQAKYKDVLGPKFINPDLVRWELHRVWVVEATLAPGKRNVIAKRRFFLDEDTWLAVLADEWDASGQLWKEEFSLQVLAPDLPGILPRPWGTYNLQTGAYLINGALNESDTPYVFVPPWPESHFTPGALAGEGQ